MAYKGSTLLAGGIEYSVEENKGQFALADASQINVDMQSTSGLEERLDEVLKKLKGNVDSVTESSGNLSDRLDDIDSSIGTLQSGLEKEKTARENGDNTLSDKLKTQTEAREATDVALAQEKTDRQNKDTQQDGRLTQLESTVSGLGQGGTLNDAKLQALQEALAEEQKNREEADTALQTAVDAAKDTADAASTAAGQASDKATALQEEIAAARTDVKGTAHGTLKESIDASFSYVNTEPGGGSGTDINIVQTTGTSTTDVMSQDAVTKALNNLNVQISELQIPPDLSSQVNSLSSQVSDLDGRLDTAQQDITTLKQKVGDGGGGTVQGLTQSEVKEMLQNLYIGTAQYLRGVDSDNPFSQGGLSYDDQADTRQYGQFHVRGTMPTIMSTKDLTNNPPPPPNPNIKHIWKAVRGDTEEVRQYGIWVPYGTPLTLSAWIYTSAESRNDFYFLVTCAQKTNHISVSDNSGVTVTGGWQKVVRRFVVDNTFGSGSLLTDTQPVNVAVGYQYKTGGDSSHKYDDDLYIAGLQLEYGDTIVSDFHDDEIVSTATSIPPAASSDGMTIRYVTTEQYNQFNSFIPKENEIVLCAVNGKVDTTIDGGAILGYFIGDGTHTTSQLPYFLMPYYKDRKAYATAIGAPGSYDSGMGTIQFALQGSANDSESMSAVDLVMSSGALGTASSSNGAFLNFISGGKSKLSIDFSDSFVVTNVSATTDSSFYSYNISPRIYTGVDGGGLMLKTDYSGSAIGLSVKIANSNSALAFTSSGELKVKCNPGQFTTTLAQQPSYLSLSAPVSSDNTQPIFPIGFSDIYQNNIHSLSKLAFYENENSGMPVIAVLNRKFQGSTSHLQASFMVDGTGNVTAQSFYSQKLNIGINNVFSAFGSNFIKEAGQAAIGYGLETVQGTLACGKCNHVSYGSYPLPFVVGIGTDTTYSERKNGFQVQHDGTCGGRGAWFELSADYAEYFEWEDGNPNGEDRVGYFVTITNEDKISIATDTSDYILGVVSATPAIIGDAAGFEWQGKYKKDVFGRQIKQYITQSDQYNEKTDLYLSGTTIECSVLNPDYDENQIYVPRKQRPEWSPIGLMGKLIVIDDGTCEVNGYCKPNSAGIATKDESNNGYRVIKRLDETHVKIILK